MSFIYRKKRHTERQTHISVCVCECVVFFVFREYWFLVLVCYLRFWKQVYWTYKHFKPNRLFCGNVHFYFQCICVHKTTMCMWVCVRVGYVLKQQQNEFVCIHICTGKLTWILILYDIYFFSVRSNSVCLTRKWVCWCVSISLELHLNIKFCFVIFFWTRRARAYSLYICGMFKLKANPTEHEERTSTTTTKKRKRTRSGHIEMTLPYLFKLQYS